MMEGSSASSSSCTLNYTYVLGTVFVSCVDSPSSGYQVILLQDNDPYNLALINVRPGEKQTVALVPRGTYCVMEVPMGDDFDLGFKYSRKFTAEEKATGLSTALIIFNASKFVRVYRYNGG